MAAAWPFCVAARGLFAVLGSEALKAMPRAPSTFRQSDATKALRATIAAGLRVVGLRINPQGEIQVEIGESRAQDSSDRREANEWDRV